MGKFLTDDGRHPWDILDGETADSYAAFRCYLEQPPRTRSLAEVCRRLGIATIKTKRGVEKPSRMVETWSAKFNWVERARQYDAWIAAAGDRAILKKSEAEAKKWAARRQQMRDEAYDKAVSLVEFADRLIDKAKLMIDMPLVEKKVVQGPGGEEIHIHPLENWSIRDAANLARAAGSMIEASSKLKELAFSMRAIVSDDFNFDLTELPDNIVKAIANGEIDVTTERGVRIIIEAVERSKT